VPATSFHLITDWSFDAPREAVLMRWGEAGLTRWLGSG
jgi:hypothetical protein